ncbi:aspartate carbamoyltransferase catalytic subunit [Agrilactobacillus yilanensis]|uniref:Aspartate carbamoyltransferase n=1 Tax=Agrilactobacillus yilanensis TaxID=2485997 RepID=A0ABW4J791_9LACO|nr:aspartate carbamoyltransferase catalytic subunit [Agrilactobacillus yilanensis]
MTILKQNFTTIEDLTETDVLSIIHRAQAFKNGETVELRRPVYAINMFFENSTRTHTSFEMAERRLGLQVLSFEAQTSSIKKGESLYDTVKTVQSIGADIAVIRHPQANYYDQLIQPDNSNIAILNGGDGAGQHPSQCLLDVMTIFEEFGHFDGLKVGIVGDLEHSRVARSNMMLLTKLGAKVAFSGPDAWYTKDFEAYGPHMSMDELVQEVDVMMLLRVQHERLTNESNESFSKEAYHEKYGLTMARAEKLQNHAIIMHPAPVNRDVEIASDLVECPQSRIFQQMSNGVYTRMAMLETVLAARHLLAPRATATITLGA